MEAMIVFFLADETRYSLLNFECSHSWSWSSVSLSESLTIGRQNCERRRVSMEISSLQTL
jgi:hypothetical protein